MVKSDDTEYRALVSVVIPAYNAAAFIERTLKSVSSQTWSELEILVVDDGSTDKTVDIVTRLAEKDARIKLLQQQNQGVSAARNLGISNARGDYIALLDADDTWMPEKIARQMEVFEDSPEQVGLVYTKSFRVFEDGRPSLYSVGNELEGEVFFTLIQGNFIENASSPLIRRTCFDRVGLFSLEYQLMQAQGCEDWDMYLRVAEHYQFRLVREHLTGYWQSTSSMSANWEVMLRSYRLMMEQVRKRHVDIPGYVFRWSRSNYYFYLANQASRGCDVISSMKLMARTIACDPVMLLNRRFQRLVGRVLLQSLRGGKRKPPPVAATEKGKNNVGGPGGRSPRVGYIWRQIFKQRMQRLNKSKGHGANRGKTSR